MCGAVNDYKKKYSIFQTKISCPRHILYLEAGIIPVRYQIQRQVLVFLQYIVQQPSNSLMKRMFDVLISHPTKRDWTSHPLELVERFKLNLTLKEIQVMKIGQLKRLVKRKMKDLALKELQKKQQGGKKGKFIKYNDLSMADYLLPESELTNEQKYHLFSARSEMNENPFNFGNKIPCS